MTRKDYIAMADAIAKLDHATAISVGEVFARVAKSDNPRFNATRFIERILEQHKELGMREGWWK